MEYLATTYLVYFTDNIAYLMDYLKYLAHYIPSIPQRLLKIQQPLDYLPGFLVAIKWFKHLIQAKDKMQGWS